MVGNVASFTPMTSKVSLLIGASRSIVKPGCPKSERFARTIRKKWLTQGGPFWSSFGVDFRTILRSILEPILDPFWEHFGADFGEFWSLCQLMSGIMFLLSLV